MYVVVVRAGLQGGGGVWEMVEQLGWGELPQSAVGSRGVRSGQV